MKRLVALILCVLFLLTFTGCSNMKGTEVLYLYYRNADPSHSSGLIREEPADSTLTRSVQSLANYYFQDPQTEGVISPFPKGSDVVSFLQDGTTLQICMNSNFAELSGVDLSLALSCISLTFTQLDGIDAVSVSVENGLLAGQESVLIHDGSILLEDNSLAMAETKLTVYYANQNSRYLIPVEIGTKLEATEEQAIYAVSLLGMDPDEDQLRRTLPKNTEVLDLSIDDGVCMLDLSGDFYRNRPKGEFSERMTILSIVNTLTQFEEIESVQFYVEGETLSNYTYMDLSLLYIRDESVIGPVRLGLNETDASLYVIRSRDMKLTELPFRIKSAANETDADALMAALLTFDERNGYVSAIPRDVILRSVRMDGSHCTVDLSDSFEEDLTTAEEATMAVDSIVNTLLSLDSVRSVSITVEGTSPNLEGIDLAQTFN